jgi:hypothetical protein
MGGLRQPTANDGAYAVLFVLTVVSFAAVWPLLVLYLALVWLARRRPPA